MSAAHVDVMIHGRTWWPWLLILPSTVLLWTRTTRPIGLAGIVTGYALAAILGQLSAIAGLWVALLAVAGWAILRGPTTWIRVIGHLLFLITTVVLRLHLAPGFHNPLAMQGDVSTGAVTYKAYFNLDKTLTAIWIVCCIRWLIDGTPPVRKAAIGCAYGVATFLPLAVLALLAGVVKFDPKLPEVTWLWALNNVILVCFAEEALFRGYIQHGLTHALRAYRWGPAFALVVASILFGLSHIGEAITMQALSIVAGLGYGLAYRRAGLIGAIGAHALLNTCHFLLLSYPALA